MDTQYTFGTSANAYYQGYDLRVRWDDRSLGVVINEKDGMLAVDVKDHDTFSNLPLAAQAAAKKIGDETAQAIYNGIQRSFWDWADDAAKSHGFDGVFQAGRSGGWVAVAGTQHLDGAALIEPDEEDEDMRDRFLAFAFEIEQAIESEDGYKQYFYKRLIAVGEEWKPPVDCPNCDHSIRPEAPTTGHADGCLISSLFTVLEDRDLDVTTFDLTKIDMDELWGRFGGPAADWLADEMGVPRYPEVNNGSEAVQS